MLRLGENPCTSADFCVQDLSILRLKLLILMACAFLDGCPFGHHRRQTVIRNADRVARDFADGLFFSDSGPTDHDPLHHLAMDHIFHQRVRLMAVMAKSFAQGNPVGYHRRATMKNNIDYLCEALGFMPEKQTTALLKVA